MGRPEASLVGVIRHPCRVVLLNEPDQSAGHVFVVQGCFVAGRDGPFGGLDGFSRRALFRVGKHGRAGKGRAITIEPALVLLKASPPWADRTGGSSRGMFQDDSGRLNNQAIAPSGNASSARSITAAISGRACQGRWLLGVYFMLLLHGSVFELVVVWRSLPWACCLAQCLSMDRRKPRRGDGKAP
jgi:hypothetical protein